MSNSINFDYLCPISHGAMLDPAKANPCGHTFDLPYLESWFNQSRSTACPLCKSHIESITRDSVLAQTIHDYVLSHPELFEGKTPDQLRQKREALLPSEKRMFLGTLQTFLRHQRQIHRENQEQQVRVIWRDQRLQAAAPARHLSWMKQVLTPQRVQIIIPVISFTVSALTSYLIQSIFYTVE